MKISKSIVEYIFWPVVLICGIIFNILNIPAPWLLGSLTVGVIYSLLIEPKPSNKNIFIVALAFIGVSLGSMMDIGLVVQTIINHFLPILFGLITILSLGWILGYILYKKSELDFKTSMYSFIPGGASEVLGVAQSDGADMRVVAAFHSVRIILYLSIIPLLVGTGSGETTSNFLLQDIQMIQDSALQIIVVIILALILNYFLPIPAGALFYSTALMVIWSLLDSSIEVPLLVAGLGQMIIGATIGLRFDINALRLLSRIKFISILLMSTLIVTSILIASVFSVWSNVDIWSSILGWVPAGAGEMASTAIFLELDETSVISIQLIRLYTVFLSLPLILKLINLYNSKI